MYKLLKNRILEYFFLKRNEYFINDKNDLNFIFSSHAIAAFIISPIFALLIYQTELPVFYFYITISYTVFFPFYFLICKSIKRLNSSIIYFFSIHLFIITLISFIQLMKSNFHINELFCFFGFYCISIIVIQRWFALMMYNVLVFLLLIYGLLEVQNLDFSIYLIVQLFVILGLVSSLTMHTEKKRKDIILRYNRLLESTLENQKSAFVIFILKPNFQVIAHSKRLHLTLSQININEENVYTSFINLLNETERLKLLAIPSGGIFRKEIYSNKTGVKIALELKINRIVNEKEELTFIALFTDVTENRKVKEDYSLLQKKYENLYFKNKAGVFTLNQKGELIQCNNSFIEMFENNYSIGDKIFNNSTKEEWNLILESLQQTGISNNYQTQLTLNKRKEKKVVFSWYIDNTTDTIEGSVIDLTSIQKTSQALQQSEQKYRLIYEETNDAILLLDNDNIVDVNRKATQLFGIVHDELIGTKLFELSANLSDLSNKKYQGNIQRLDDVKSIKFNWLFKGKTKSIEAEVTLIEITIGKKLFYQCVIHDNTESNGSLRALRKNQRSLANILENNPEGILIVNNNEILYINTSTRKLIGEFIDFHSIFQGADQQMFEKEYARHQQDRKTKNGQFRIKEADVLTDVTMVSTNYEEEEATLIIIKDISAQNKLDKEKLRAEFAEEANKLLEIEIKEKIKAEQLLEEQYLRTKAIIDSSNYTFLLTLNLDGQITSFNKHLETYIKEITNQQLKLSDNYKKYFNKAISEQRLIGFESMLKSVKKGKSYKFEVLLKPGDKTYWLEVFMSPIFDTKGEVIEVSMVAHDSSEKKQISLNIGESLKEKEILLKEIHHRVKNNLQVISSILNLQSSFVTDENTLEILQESRNRIRTMAIIHENLYRTEDFSSINFSSYLENLLGNLVASYRINEEVVLETNLEEVDLVLDQAIPCGLLVNELITNALKYAWKQSEKGTITINLYQKGTEIHLNIFDDGIGLPFNFKETKPETLGLQLVETLIEQLDGELEVKNENGTKYFIKFENTKR
jgi:PAS domain S-box-containing protein